MKFTKQQIEKALIITMIGFGCLYYFFTELLGPLTPREAKAQREIAELQKKIKSAEQQIARTNKIKADDVHAEAAANALVIMKKKIPNGSPVAWFPTRLSEFFHRHGIPKENFRPGQDLPEPEFPGLKNSTWVIDLPAVNFGSLGMSLADLENEEALIQITDIQIDTLGKEADIHHAQLTITTLVKSEK